MRESVATILFQNGEILLIERRDIPVWVLPGGGIEPGEAPEEAACRETKEETGCSVEIVRKIAVYTPTNRLARVTHFYEVKLKSGFLQTGNETRALKFYSVDKLPKRLPPPYHDWINDAVARYPTTIERKIAGVSYSTLFKLLFKHPIIVGRFLLTKIGIHFNW